MMLEELEINVVLKRIVKELDKKLNVFLKSRKKRGEKTNKNDFFTEVKKNKYDFPVRRDTYYNYGRALNKKSDFILKKLDLGDFYKICQYTNVSADYYLGFIYTKRKESSAPQVKQDFGLSDKAMDTLSQINNHKAEEKGELSADVVNYIFEDKDFWEELNAKLPVYISALVYNLDDANTDAARYGVMRAFETLLNHLSEKCINSDLRNAKVDPLAPFQSDII